MTVTSQESIPMLLYIFIVVKSVIYLSTFVIFIFLPQYNHRIKFLNNALTVADV